jgi:hypothetical protein
MSVIEEEITLFRKSKSHEILAVAESNKDPIFRKFKSIGDFEHLKPKNQDNIIPSQQ